MHTPILTFFNNKGGVGKTSLVYHLAWMLALLNKTVVMVDLDPQANLTAACLDEDQIDDLWSRRNPGETIYECVKPLAGVQDLASPILQKITTRLFLLPGDVSLSSFEDTLSAVWPISMADTQLFRPMRILTAFWDVMQQAAHQVHADVVMVDIGPNLGAINRSVLLGTSFVAIPLGADLFSLQGLANLGPTLRSWRSQWKKRLENWSDSVDGQEHADFQLPEGKMEPIGYLCQQYGVRLDRPVTAYDKWIQKIPQVYREAVLGEITTDIPQQADDPYCLSTIKHYRSLVPMAQEKHKPIFKLTSADGAIGSHANAVQDAWKDFKRLALIIADKIGLEVNSNPS